MSHQLACSCMQTLLLWQMCVMFSHTVEKALLAPAFSHGSHAQLPNHNENSTVMPMSQATILSSLSVPLHNPEYFGRSSSSFTFSYFTIYVTLWHLCLRDPEFNILDARVFRAYFYVNVHYEYPRRSVGSKTYLVTRYICVCVCAREYLCVCIKLQRAKVQCKML